MFPVNQHATSRHPLHPTNDATKKGTVSEGMPSNYTTGLGQKMASRTERLLAGCIPYSSHWLVKWSTTGLNFIKSQQVRTGLSQRLPDPAGPGQGDFRLYV